MTTTTQIARKRRAALRKRIPLTITLDPKTFAFVEQCTDLRTFQCVDELFEAALKIYKQHTRALLAYTKLQRAKGWTREEALRSVRYELLITRTADRSSRTSARKKA